MDLTLILHNLREHYIIHGQFEGYLQKVQRKCERGLQILLANGAQQIVYAVSSRLLSTQGSAGVSMQKFGQTFKKLHSVLCFYFDVLVIENITSDLLRPFL